MLPYPTASPVTKLHSSTEQLAREITILTPHIHVSISKMSLSVNIPAGTTPAGCLLNTDTSENRQTVNQYILILSQKHSRKLIEYREMYSCSSLMKHSLPSPTSRMYTNTHRERENVHVQGSTVNSSILFIHKMKMCV